MKKSRAALIVSLALIVVILHIAGLWLEFYWRLGWYDRVVHTLAGITVALVIFSIGTIRQYITKSTLLFLGAIIVSLIVGIIWELFELKAGITHLGDRGYMMDTTWDIISDVSGGIIAGAYLLLTT